MLTKKNLKSLIRTLADINALLISDVEGYKRKAETDNDVICQLKQELKIAKRNEPIFTANRFETNNLKETNSRLKCEIEEYKALTNDLRKKVLDLTNQLESKKKTAKKTNT